MLLWRSRGLLFAVLAKPHRAEPICARAYITILETIDFLNRCPRARDTWERLFEEDNRLQSSLIMQFSMACALFEIEWHAVFQLSLWGKVSFTFIGMAKTDLKRVLQMLCAHRMYTIATSAKRKDVVPSSGFFDKQATTRSFKWFEKKFPENFLLQHLQSMMVGCNPTADRACSAGTATTPLCRFCAAAKEDTFHLVHNCTSLPPALERPPDDQWYGPNFQMLGLIETSWDEVAARFRISPTAEILVEEWIGRALPTTHLWTDGSVVASKYFWKARAAFAVIDQDTCVVASPLGFVILHGRALCHSGHTDSLTIVQQFQRLLLLDHLPCNLQHLAWWKFLFHLIDERGGKESCPLHLSWCPAHNWDHLPLESITDEMLDFKNLSREDLVNKKRLTSLQESILRVTVLLPCGKLIWIFAMFKDTISGLPNFTSTFPRTPPTGFQPHLLLQLSHKRRHQPTTRCFTLGGPADFTALSPAVDGDFSGYRGKIKHGNWDIATRWLAGLRWQVADGYVTSFLELAAQSFYDGLHFTPNKDESESLQATVSHIRAVIAAALKIGHQLCPGTLEDSFYTTPLFTSLPMASRKESSCRK